MVILTVIATLAVSSAVSFAHDAAEKRPTVHRFSPGALEPTVEASRCCTGGPAGLVFSTEGNGFIAIDSTDNTTVEPGTARHFSVWVRAVPATDGAAVQRIFSMRPPAWWSTTTSGFHVQWNPNQVRYEVEVSVNATTYSSTAENHTDYHIWVAEGQVPLLSDTWRLITFSLNAIDGSARLYIDAVPQVRLQNLTDLKKFGLVPKSEMGKSLMIGSGGHYSNSDLVGLIGDLTIVYMPKGTDGKVAADTIGSVVHGLLGARVCPFPGSASATCFGGIYKRHSVITFTATPRGMIDGKWHSGYSAPNSWLSGGALVDVSMPTDYVALSNAALAHGATCAKKKTYGLSIYGFPKYGSAFDARIVFPDGILKHGAVNVSLFVNGKVGSQNCILADAPLKKSKTGTHLNQVYADFRVSQGKTRAISLVVALDGVTGSDSDFCAQNVFTAHAFTSVSLEIDGSIMNGVWDDALNYSAALLSPIRSPSYVQLIFDGVDDHSVGHYDEYRLVPAPATPASCVFNPVTAMQIKSPVFGSDLAVVTFPPYGLGSYGLCVYRGGENSYHAWAGGIVARSVTNYTRAGIIVANRPKTATPLWPGEPIRTLLHLGKYRGDVLPNARISTDFFINVSGGEAQLRPVPGSVGMTVDGTPFTWTAFEEPLGVFGTEPHSKNQWVSYYALAIYSHVDQDIVFEFAHEYGARVWCGGERIFKHSASDGGAYEPSTPVSVTKGWTQCIFKHSKMTGNTSFFKPRLLRGSHVAWALQIPGETGHHSGNYKDVCAPVTTSPSLFETCVPGVSLDEKECYNVGCCWTKAGCKRQPGTARTWRIDGRCGPGFSAPGATMATCNIDSSAEATCCSSAGWCGGDVDWCFCAGCHDYAYERNPRCLYRNLKHSSAACVAPSVTFDFVNRTDVHEWQAEDHCRVECEKHSECSAFVLSRNRLKCTVYLGECDKLTRDPANGPIEKRYCNCSFEKRCDNCTCADDPTSHSILVGDNITQAECSKMCELGPQCEVFTWSPEDRKNSAKQPIGKCTHFSRCSKFTSHAKAGSVSMAYTCPGINDKPPIIPSNSSIDNTDYGFFEGCYADEHGDLLMRSPDFHFLMDKMTPSMCEKKCYGLGTLFFGLFNGTDCMCGVRRPEKYVKKPDDECKVKCPGDSKLACGGREATALYLILPPVQDCAQPQIMSHVPPRPKPSDSITVVQEYVKQSWYFRLGARCYRYNPGEHSSYHEARRTCHNESGTLASASTRAESLFMLSIMHLLEGHAKQGAAPRSWIGAVADNNGDSFAWTDGSAWAFTEWRFEEPGQTFDKYGSRCMEQFTNYPIPWKGAWNDDFCDVHRAFVCSRWISEDARLPVLAVSAAQNSEMDGQISDVPFAKLRSFAIGEMIDPVVYWPLQKDLKSFNSSLSMTGTDGKGGHTTPKFARIAPGLTGFDGSSAVAAMAPAAADISGNAVSVCALLTAVPRTSTPAKRQIVVVKAKNDTFMDNAAISWGLTIEYGRMCFIAGAAHICGADPLMPKRLHRVCGTATTALTALYVNGQRVAQSRGSRPAHHTFRKLQRDPRNSIFVGAIPQRLAQIRHGVSSPAGGLTDPLEGVVGSVFISSAVMSPAWINAEVQFMPKQAREVLPYDRGTPGMVEAYVGENASIRLFGAGLAEMSHVRIAPLGVKCDSDLQIGEAPIPFVDTEGRAMMPFPFPVHHKKKEDITGGTTSGDVVLPVSRISLTEVEDFFRNRKPGNVTGMRVCLPTVSTLHMGSNSFPSDSGMAVIPVAVRGFANHPPTKEDPIGNVTRWKMVNATDFPLTTNVAGINLRAGQWLSLSTSPFCTGSHVDGAKQSESVITKGEQLTKVTPDGLEATITFKEVPNEFSTVFYVCWRQSADGRAASTGAHFLVERPNTHIPIPIAFNDGQVAFTSETYRVGLPGNPMVESFAHPCNSSSLKKSLGPAFVVYVTMGDYIDRYLNGEGADLCAVLLNESIPWYAGYQPDLADIRLPRRLSHGDPTDIRYQGRAQAIPPGIPDWLGGSRSDFPADDRRTLASWGTKHSQSGDKTLNSAGATGGFGQLSLSDVPTWYRKFDVVAQKLDPSRLFLITPFPPTVVYEDVPFIISAYMSDVHGARKFPKNGKGKLTFMVDCVGFTTGPLAKPLMTVSDDEGALDLTVTLNRTVLRPTNGTHIHQFYCKVSVPKIQQLRPVHVYTAVDALPAGATPIINDDAVDIDNHAAGEGSEVVGAVPPQMLRLGSHFGIHEHVIPNGNVSWHDVLDMDLIATDEGERGLTPQTGEATPTWMPETMMRNSSFAMAHKWIPVSASKASFWDQKIGAYDSWAPQDSTAYFAFALYVPEFQRIQIGVESATAAVRVFLDSEIQITFIPHHARTPNKTSKYTPSAGYSSETLLWSGWHQVVVKAVGILPESTDRPSPGFRILVRGSGLATALSKPAGLPTGASRLWARNNITQLLHLGDTMENNARGDIETDILPEGIQHIQPVEGERSGSRTWTPIMPSHHRGIFVVPPPRPYGSGCFANSSAHAVCSDRGVCGNVSHGTGTCKCDSGFGGSQCQQQCPGGSATCKVTPAWGARTAVSFLAFGIFNPQNELSDIGRHEADANPANRLTLAVQHNCPVRVFVGGSEVIQDLTGPSEGTGVRAPVSYATLDLSHGWHQVIIKAATPNANPDSAAWIAVSVENGGFGFAPSIPAQLPRGGLPFEGALRTMLRLEAMTATTEAGRQKDVVESAVPGAENGVNSWIGEKVVNLTLHGSVVPHAAIDVPYYVNWPSLGKNGKVTNQTHGRMIKFRWIPRTRSEPVFGHRQFAGSSLRFYRFALYTPKAGMELTPLSTHSHFLSLFVDGERRYRDVKGNYPYPAQMRSFTVSKSGWHTVLAVQATPSDIAIVPLPASHNNYHNASAQCSKWRMAVCSRQELCPFGMPRPDGFTILTPIHKSVTVAVPVRDVPNGYMNVGSDVEVAKQCKMMIPPHGQTIPPAEDRQFVACCDSANFAAPRFAIDFEEKGLAWALEPPVPELPAPNVTVRNERSSAPTVTITVNETVVREAFKKELAAHPNASLDAAIQYTTDGSDPLAVSSGATVYTYTHPFVTHKRMDIAVAAVVRITWHEADGSPTTIRRTTPVTRRVVEPIHAVDFLIGTRTAIPASVGAPIAFEGVAPGGAVFIVNASDHELIENALTNFNVAQKAGAGRGHTGIIPIKREGHTNVAHVTPLEPGSYAVVYYEFPQPRMEGTRGKCLLLVLAADPMPNTVLARVETPMSFGGGLSAFDEVVAILPPKASDSNCVAACADENLSPGSPNAVHAVAAYGGYATMTFGEKTEVTCMCFRPGFPGARSTEHPGWRYALQPLPIMRPIEVVEQGGGGDNGTSWLIGGTTHPAAASSSTKIFLDGEFHGHASEYHIEMTSGVGRLGHFPKCVPTLATSNRLYCVMTEVAVGTSGAWKVNVMRNGKQLVVKPGHHQSSIMTKVMMVALPPKPIVTAVTGACASESEKCVDGALLTVIGQNFNYFTPNTVEVRLSGHQLSSSAAAAVCTLIRVRQMAVECKLGGVHTGHKSHFNVTLNQTVWHLGTGNAGHHISDVSQAQGELWTGYGGGAVGFAPYGSNHGGGGPSPPGPTYAPQPTKAPHPSPSPRPTATPANHHGGAAGGDAASGTRTVSSTTLIIVAAVAGAVVVVLGALLLRTYKRVQSVEAAAKRGREAGDVDMDYVSMNA